MIAPEMTNIDPLINRTIEGYHFIRRLGEGTYGMVYLARHPRIKERLVAVKYVKLENSRESVQAEKEIDILARLHHPNIVDIYDAYRFDTYQLIVMQLVRGGSLQDSLLRLSGLLDLKYVVEGIEQLASALSYVHEQNVLHLDLKPANILLDPIAEGQVARFMLTDFGIAQIVNPKAAMSTGMLGTPIYMSPEHFGFGDSKPDARSDIYSLGIILYELIVGHVPFQSTNLLELLNQHAYAPVPLPSKTVSHLPPFLDNIILRALAKSPQERFQNAAELSAALRELRTAPLAELQTGFGGRVPGQALGAIAQAGAAAMDVFDAENPPKERTHTVNVVVMGQDGSQQLINLKQPSAVIGRDKTADLQLEHKTVSRRHAQIDYDRKGVLYVTDLDSANGTYLDGVRLAPMERVVWKADQFLQIQGFLLQISREIGSESSPLLLTTDQIKLLLDRVQGERKRSSVRMSLSPAIVYVELGKPQYIQVHISVENTPTARYELRAKTDPGIDERWYTLPASQLIANGETVTFDFIVSMPLTGTVGDNTHEIALQIVADNPDIPTAYQVLKVRVVPFTRFTLALRPSEISHNRRRKADLFITNTGNQPERFNIELEAPDTLKIRAQPAQLLIQPAQEQTVRLHFKPRRDRNRIRSRLIYGVVVHAASGAIERTNGSYVFEHHQRIPLIIWLVWIVFIIVMARWLLFGVSLGDQWSQLYMVLELLVRRIRGG